MHCIYLKDSRHKEKQHPLVEHILEIRHIVCEYLLHEPVCIINHKNTGQHKEYVCRCHYFLEPPHSDIIAFICLHHLHCSEHHSTCKIYPAHYFLLPHKGEASCSNHHQHSSDKEYYILSPTQLFHRYLFPVYCHRSAHICPHRRLS